MNFPPDPQAEATAEAFRYPQVGDYFTEIYAYYFFVLEVTTTRVLIMEVFPPCTIPEEGKLTVLSRVGYRSRFAYGTQPGYWVRLIRRGVDVTGWREACQNPPESIEPYLELWE